mmetsp:Transcript_7229/g.7112  ORF Transcript_7229/g.7112 Transcript_7229/m.7112 type:complete len:151 (+) Transcript_7229:116-568(+)
MESPIAAEVTAAEMKKMTNMTPATQENIPKAILTCFFVAQNGGVTQLSLNACLENIGSSGDSQGADVDTAWCISNTAFIAVVDDWAIGVLIGVWIITVLVLLLSVSNGALACTIRKKQVKGGVILATPAEVPQTSHSSGEEAEKQVVNSV